MAGVDKNKLIDSANKFIAKNQFDKAIKDLQKVLETEPKNNQVALKIAELFLKLDKKQDAITYYEFASNIFRDSGFYDKAIAVYRQVLTLNTLSSHAYLKLAELFRKKNLVAEAVSNYKVAIAIFEKEGKVQDALKILQTITELEPSNLPGRMKLANLYIKNGLKDEAYTEFARISDRLVEAKKTIDLITVYEKMLTLKPGETNVSKQLIKLYLSRGDYQKVLLKVKEVIASGKSDTEALIALAKAYVALEKTPLAISAYKEVAKLYSKGGLASQAQDIYKKILELDPTDEQVLQIVVGATQPDKPMIEIEPEPFEAVKPPAQEKKPEKAILKPPEVKPLAAKPPVAKPEKKIAVELEEKKPQEKKPQEKKEKLSSEEIDKYFSEAQVYKRYGLNAKAAEKFVQILNINPSHKTALIELFELYQLDKKSKEVSEIAEKLYNLFIADGEIEKGEDFVKKALSGDPGNDVLKALIGVSTEPTEGTVPVEQPVEEEIIEVIEQPVVEQTRHVQEQAENREEKEPVAEQQELNEPASQEIDTGIEIEVETPLPENNGMEEPQQAQAAEAGITEETRQQRAVKEEPKEEIPIPEQIEFIPETDNVPKEMDTASPTPETEEIEFSFSDEEATPVKRVTGRQEQSAAEQAAPEPHKPEVDVIDSLDEAEFYYQQGILTEAKGILLKILKAFPNEERAKKRLDEIIAKEEKQKPAPKEPEISELEESFIQKEADSVVSVSADEDLFDLARELENELSTSASKTIAPPAPVEEEQQVSVEEVLEAFKKGVEKSVDKQDAETHYSLGIAYKEMGLIDEAINEFNIAILSPEKKADGLIMLGMSYMGKGLPGKAIEMYKQALSVKGGIKQENIGLIYEYALALEAYGDMKNAYNSFQEVEKIDDKFRDIKEKINKLAEFAKDETVIQPEVQKHAEEEKFTLDDILREDDSQEPAGAIINKQMPEPGPEDKKTVSVIPEEKSPASESDAETGKAKQPKKKVSYI